MSSINRVQRKAVSEEGVKPSEKSSTKARLTASKVASVMQVDLRPKTPLAEVKNLARKVQKEWNSLELEDLAENIIGLEDRVAKLDPSTPGLAKVKAMVEDLHFKFVFPVALELEKSTEEMPPTFHEVVKEVAARIFKKESFAPLSFLTDLQRKEIERYTKVGG